MTGMVDKTFLGTGWGFPPSFEGVACAARMVSAEQDVRESLHILLSTNPGERVMQPAYGCGLKRRVFDSIDESLLTEIRDEIFGVTWLALILFTLFYNGLAGLNLAVFTQNTPPPGSTDGGLLNAIVGSIIMTVIGVGIGAPLGLFAGTYLAEYGRNDKLTSVIRFINDILLSAPSIIIGLFVYGAIVVPMGGFSAFAGCLALAVIVIPVVVRTTEDMLLLVPNPLREAASARIQPSIRLGATSSWITPRLAAVA